MKEEWRYAARMNGKYLDGKGKFATKEPVWYKSEKELEKEVQDALLKEKGPIGEVELVEVFTRVSKFKTNVRKIK